MSDDQDILEEITNTTVHTDINSPEEITIGDRIKPRVVERERIKSIEKDADNAHNAIIDLQDYALAVHKPSPKIQSDDSYYDPTQMDWVVDAIELKEKL